MIKQLFRPYIPDFINEEFESIKYHDEKVSIERKLKKNPELIIDILNNIPETEESVFNRLKKLGGIKWYRYLYMSNPVIQWLD